MTTMGERRSVEGGARPPDGDLAVHAALAPSDWVAGRAKRAFDLAVASALAALTAPLLLVLAIGSAISFRAWPFFCQDRMGRHGTTFRIIKVRSLPRVTPSYADKYSLGAYETTRWGRMIRRTHLDELPQLWLVITGTMSLVGPRPEMPVVAELFPEAFVRTRCAVRPGCTGLWQVGPHASGLIGENPHYDLYYVSSGTFGVDARVLVRTITRMLGADALTLRSIEAIEDDRRPEPLST